MPPERILIVTGKALAKATYRELPEIPRRNILLEPCRRDTAAAVATLAAHARAAPVVMWLAASVNIGILAVAAVCAVRAFSARRFDRAAARDDQRRTGRNLDARARAGRPRRIAALQRQRLAGCNVEDRGRILFHVERAEAGGRLDFKIARDRVDGSVLELLPRFLPNGLRMRESRFCRNRHKGKTYPDEGFRPRQDPFCPVFYLHGILFLLPIRASLLQKYTK